MLVNQPTSEPTEKMKAVGAAGSIVTIVLLVGSILGVTLPAESVNAVAVGVSALVSLVTFVAGYYRKNKV